MVKSFLLPPMPLKKCAVLKKNQISGTDCNKGSAEKIASASNPALL